MCSQTLRAGNLETPRDALHRLKNKAVVSLKITVLWHATPCGLAHTGSEERTPSIFRVDEYHYQSSRDLELRLQFF
jgi:hypothetical protein